MRVSPTPPQAISPITCLKSLNEPTQPFRALCVLTQPLRSIVAQRALQEHIEVCSKLSKLMEEAQHTEQGCQQTLLNYLSQFFKALYQCRSKLLTVIGMIVLEYLYHSIESITEPYRTISVLYRSISEYSQLYISKCIEFFRVFLVIEYLYWCLPIMFLILSECSQQYLINLIITLLYLTQYLSMSLTISLAVFSNYLSISL